VILRAPRKNDVYSLDLKNIIPSGGVTCLVAKATNDEVVLWHRRLGHVNLKNINKLVQGNLVRGLPSKTFKIDHSCLACNKGKQHRASCKKVKERTIREPLELLHMDLFGPVSVESINKKKYCLVVTDDYSKFSWVFFLAYKDETYDMLHDLIVGLENRLRHKEKGKEENIYCKGKRTFKPASTPIEAHKSLGKDEEGEDVDVHLYRSSHVPNCLTTRHNVCCLSVCKVSSHSKGLLHACCKKGF
ncbi:putative ribonuclease H-like domain-containing protein, partial [Tanacetum coccineum]